MLKYCIPANATICGSFSNQACRFLSRLDLGVIFLSFGCKVIEINGHNILKITKALKAKSKSKPKVIIANTIKGKDISFMENNNLWHYKNPNSKQLQLAIKEINNKYA